MRKKRKLTRALAEKVGAITKHIIHYESGNEKTFENVISDSIKVSSFTHMDSTEGYTIGVSHGKVEWFEVHPQK